MDWMEQEFGQGTVMKINERLRDRSYNEALFEDITGQPVQQLWKQYKDIVRQ